MAVFTNIEGKGIPKKGVSLRRMFEQLDESNKYSQFFLRIYGSRGRSLRPFHLLRPIWRRRTKSLRPVIH